MHIRSRGFICALLMLGLIVSGIRPATAQLRDTAFGFDALMSVAPTGDDNSAFGDTALKANTVGSYNTAVGSQALSHNVFGLGNTALGFGTLNDTTNADYNTAVGQDALYTDTTGSENTAIGLASMSSNTTGNGNTAAGQNSLAANISGNFNTASGTNALSKNSNGINNTASGSGALFSNTTGVRNSAAGSNSLYKNTTGSNNIGIGYQGGYYPTTGSHNIEIGSAGAAADNAVIRLGTQGTQTKTYVAGIRGVNVTGGVPVLVTATGQLGVMSSSRRYKEDIRSMGKVSDRLLALRPVTFRYKIADENGQKPEQYGLIAEEVARVMPELVVYNQKGQPETVAYQTLAPLLLNELQREHKRANQQANELQEARNQLASVQSELIELRRITTQLAANRERAAADAQPDTALNLSQ
jgi:trimeric autotransporter adhesin